MFTNRPRPGRIAPVAFAVLATVSYVFVRESNWGGTTWLAFFGLPAVVGAALARFWNAESPFGATLRGAALFLLGVGTLASFIVTWYLSVVVLPVALAIGGIAQLVSRSDPRHEEPLWIARMRRARERADRP